MYILSQIIEVLALITALISYHLKTKKQIFKGMCISAILDIVHYLLLNAYSGFFTKLLALIRNVFILKKDDNEKLNKKIYLVVFILLTIVLGILTFNDIYSILPFIAAIIYLIVVWNGSELQIKKIAFLCYFLWIIYNISVLSVMGIISNIIALISTYIAYINEKRSV